MIFLTAFAARVIFYLIYQRYDAGFMTHEIGINHWLLIAKNLASGHGYTNHALLTYFPSPSLQATAARGPVPVLMLSLLVTFFPGSELVFFAYAWTLSALTAVLLYRLSQRILGSERQAVTAAILFCFFLPEMYISTAYASASEGLFTFLLFAYFYTAMQGIEKRSLPNALMAGILAAAAALTRPIALLFPIFFLFQAVRKHQQKAAMLSAIFLSAFIACIIPWAIRNQITFGKPVFSTTLNGYNLLRHNYGLAQKDYSLHTAEDFAPYAKKTIAASGERLESVSETRLDEIFQEEALRVIRRYPGRYLRACLHRAGWLWYKIGVEKPVYFAQMIPLYLFMFPGILLAIFRRHPLRAFVPYFACFFLAYASVNAQFRFICPLMPCGIMFAVYMIFELYKRIFQKGRGGT
ncbi:MAG: glycosyltransferase family 39 protein [Candidatus Omnitrophota bacterium]|jgi:hypothetical protein